MGGEGGERGGRGGEGRVGVGEGREDGCEKNKVDFFVFNNNK